MISTDLSHFHRDSEAQQLDANTANRIEQLDDTLRGDQACGCYPLNGLLKLAQQKALTVERLALCNSYQSAGADKNRVVGYGAFALH